MSVTIKEVIEWLEHGVPSDAVILKEGVQHFDNPKPLSDITKLELSLITLVRFIYPRGRKDIEGKSDIYKDMIQRFKKLCN